MNRRTVRIWLPEELVTAVKERVGAERFDDYVVAAVEKCLRLDLLDDLLAELDAEYGPVPAEVRAQTAITWPTYEDDQADS